MDTQLFIETLVANKAKGYLVGGAVRDFFKNKPAKDRDYCVTGLSQEAFETIFPYAQLQGKDFPVYRMDIDGESCEVALARTERKVTEGHKGFTIVSSPSITIEEDLARRDFTMNAMAIDLETNELIDPFNGRADLTNALIRATSPAFTEDPLRVYRAARFAAQHGFYIDDGTIELMHQLKDELSSLSIERVRAELDKTFMSQRPSRFFGYLKEAGVLDVHFPEIDCLSEYKQNPAFHPEGDVFKHTMQVLDTIPLLQPFLDVKSKRTVMYSALLHDVGKAITMKMNPKTGHPSYFGHESAGVPIAEAFLDRFKMEHHKKAILFNVEKHMIMHDAFTAMSNGKAVDFIHGKFAYSGEHYVRKTGLLQVIAPSDYLIVCIADVIGRVPYSSQLRKVVDVAINIMHKFDRMAEFELDHFSSYLSFILGDRQLSKSLVDNLVTAAKHKRIMELYLDLSEDVIYSGNLEETKKLHSGEKLGFVIHTDKRKQRSATMKYTRSSIENYVTEVVMYDES